MAALLRTLRVRLGPPLRRARSAWYGRKHWQRLPLEWGTPLDFTSADGLRLGGLLYPATRAGYKPAPTTSSPPHPLTLSPRHPVTLSPPHLVTPSPRRRFKSASAMGNLLKQVEERQQPGMSRQGMTAVPVTPSPPHPLTLSPPPALILLHSSDPLGQRHGFYLALARAMQARGFTVLTFDLRGYPDSEQPRPEALTMSHLVADVQAAYEALCETGRADPQRIALYGHSYGGGIVLPALLAGLPFYKAILHSPPDWNGPRMTDEGATQRDLFHERFWRYMRLPRPVPLPLFLQLARDLDLLNAIPQLPAGHVPLLLLDGSREGHSLRSFMQTAYARLSPPVDYYTVPGADHFGNTVIVNGRVWIDGRVVEVMAEYLRVWLGL